MRWPSPRMFSWLFLRSLAPSQPHVSLDSGYYDPHHGSNAGTYPATLAVLLGLDSNFLAATTSNVLSLRRSYFRLNFADAFLDTRMCRSTNPL